MLTDAGNPCLGVNCTVNGQCFQGRCVCLAERGYSGDHCEVAPTPVDGVTSAWSPPGSCSRACGGGVAVSTRTCVSPPLYGGAACGALSRSQVCNTDPCTHTIDGGLSPWSEWGPCNATCPSGVVSAVQVPGVRVRTRMCDSPAPSSDGAPCVGAVVDYGKCGCGFGDAARGTEGVHVKRVTVHRRTVTDSRRVCVREINLKGRNLDWTGWFIFAVVCSMYFSHGRS